MPLFYCSHCGQRIDAEDSLAGESALCPTCGGGITVPLPRSASPARGAVLPDMPSFHGREQPPPVPPPPAGSSPTRSTPAVTPSPRRRVSSRQPDKASSLSPWVITTVIAAVCAASFVLVSPPTVLEEIGWRERTFLGSFAQALGFLAAAVIISLALASIVGGFAALFGVP